MDACPIVTCKDGAVHSEYRTKRLIPDADDRLAGRPLQERLLWTPIAIEQWMTNEGVEEPLGTKQNSGSLWSAAGTRQRTACRSLARL
jgi:hypothetical protein